jgi:hypothetical protein
MELEQRHIVKFLHFKDLKLGDIALELFNLYGQVGHAKPSIKNWLPQLRLGRKDLTTQHMGGRPTLDETDTEIPSVLRISLFPWVRRIANSPGIPASMVFLALRRKDSLQKRLTPLGSADVDPRTSAKTNRTCGTIT